MRRVFSSSFEVSTVFKGHTIEGNLVFSQFLGKESLEDFFNVTLNLNTLLGDLLMLN